MASSRRRWVVVVLFFLFMLLHQADKLLIGPLTSQIITTFGITEEEMGRVLSGALVIGAVLYPLWGYLYDRYSRPKLLALASLIWGSTTWLSAIAPTYPIFMGTRASTGIDDASYPGIYSLIADYFPPGSRGRVYGILQLAVPTGYLLGMILANLLSPMWGWRGVYYFTGAIGVLLAILIFFGVQDIPRGGGEPELENLAETGLYKFEWSKARDLFRKPTMLLLFAQGFFGVFPWTVITYWFFRYLEVERNYSGDKVIETMVTAVLVLSFATFMGGMVGDWLFKRTPRGRLIVALTGVSMGAVMMTLTLKTPLDNPGLFMVLLAGACFFIPLASANVISTVYDITVPEVRSTALAIQYFIESSGAALAPWMAGLIVTNYGFTLGNAIWMICLVAWTFCLIFFSLVTYRIPRDIAALRQELRYRAEHPG